MRTDKKEEFLSIKKPELKDLRHPQTVHIVKEKKHGQEHQWCGWIMSRRNCKAIRSGILIAWTERIRDVGLHCHFELDSRAVWLKNVIFFKMRMTSEVIKEYPTYCFSVNKPEPCTIYWLRTEVYIWIIGFWDFLSTQTKC